MKLILESWRRYLKEFLETPITKLRVFDFDDTLAHNVAKVKVVNTKTGEIRTLDSQEEFDAYEETEGEDLDYSEQLDEFLEDPDLAEDYYNQTILDLQNLGRDEVIEKIYDANFTMVGYRRHKPGTNFNTSS